MYILSRTFCAETLDDAVSSFVPSETHESLFDNTVQEMIDSLSFFNEEDPVEEPVDCDSTTDDDKDVKLCNVAAQAEDVASSLEVSVADDNETR